MKTRSLYFAYMAIIMSIALIYTDHKGIAQILLLVTIGWFIYAIGDAT